MPETDLLPDFRRNSLSPDRAIGCKKTSEAVDTLERSHVVNELIATEETFNDRVKILSKILHDGDTNVPISKEDIRAIAVNLNDFVDVSNNLIKAYRHAVAKSPDRSLAQAPIGKSMLPVLSIFHNVVVEYMKEFDSEIVKYKPHLAKYFQHVSSILQKQDTYCGSLDIALLQIYRHVFDMLNLLKRLFVCTPESHPDKVHVKKAYDTLRDTCDAAEQCKRENFTDERFPSSVDPDDLLAENSRLEYYRQRQKSLLRLTGLLINWIESTKDDLKQVIQYRRFLIKAIHQTMQSLESVPYISFSHQLYSRSVQHKIGKFDPNVVDSFCSNVLDRLNELNGMLKMKNRLLNTLSSRAKDLSDQLKNKSNKLDTMELRKQEARAITMTERTVKSAEDIVKTCLIYYFSNVRNLLSYTVIGDDGRVKLHEANLGMQIGEDINNWRQRLEKIKLLPNHSTTGSSEYTNSQPGGVSANGVSLPPAIPRQQFSLCRVLTTYKDDQTSDTIMPGEHVKVLRWTDYLGNSEWAKIRTETGSEFFYPASYLWRLT